MIGRPTHWDDAIPYEAETITEAKIETVIEWQCVKKYRRERKQGEGRE